MQPHDAKLMLSLLVLVFTPIAGAVFFAVNEQWSFIDALYWSVITATTIGYGDMSLNEQSSRTFSIFYITFSVVVLAHCLGTFSVVTEDKKKEKQVLELKAKAQKMDPSFLMEILEGKHAHHCRRIIVAGRCSASLEGCCCRCRRPPRTYWCALSVVSCVASDRPLFAAPAPRPCTSLPSLLRPHRRLVTVGVVGICVA